MKHIKHFATCLLAIVASIAMTSCERTEELYIGSDWTRYPEWPQGEWVPSPEARDKTTSTPPEGAKPGVKFLYRDAKLDLFILNWNGDVLHKETGALRQEIHQMHLDHQEYLARKESSRESYGSGYGGGTTTQPFEADFRDERTTSSGGYQSRVTPEMARTVASAVYQHSLQQNRVQVRGHMRENTYIDSYSRTPAGGYSSGDHFEAGAKGAAAAGALMLLDWAAQKLEEQN
jgi:hypothetical protein